MTIDDLNENRIEEMKKLGLKIVPTYESDIWWTYLCKKDELKHRLRCRELSELDYHWGIFRLTRYYFRSLDPRLNALNLPDLNQIYANPIEFINYNYPGENVFYKDSKLDKRNAEIWNDALESVQNIAYWYVMNKLEKIEVL